MLRRMFLRYPALTLLGTAYGVPQGTAAAPRTSAWQAAHHAQDDWFDDNAAKHRVIFDTWNPEHFPDAIQFAGNTFDTNKSDYDIPNDQMAVVIVCRHRTTPFAFNDAMWAKYGKSFAAQMEGADPKTKDVPATSPYKSGLTRLAALGLQFAVCNRTTHAYANRAARDAGLKNDDVYNELKANTVIPAHIVPAGVIAVTRAVERGYVNISIG
jgi:intracellular sulfur oxidation DsrE/DsrF family protein